MGIEDRVAARALLFTQETHRTKTAAFPEGGGESAAAREIPQDHPFDKRALKPLAKALWSSTVALGHALAAYRHLSRLKSSSVSPDGRMGGRGYVMSMADMRRKLHEASESLSLISDTIYDEITGPHWKPKLAQLDENDREDVGRFVEEAKNSLADPEADADEEAREIEEENDEDPPVKTAAWVKAAASSVPDSNSEDTPTESWDWGLGYGAKGQGAGGYANPAGQSDGSGKGTYGPSSGMPGQAPQSSGDVSTRDPIDSKINPRHAAFKAAYRAIYGCDCSVMPQDEAGPVSRSDYYQGPKDNLVSVMAASEMPAPPTAVTQGGGNRSLTDTYYVQEDRSRSDAVFNDTTKTMRNPSGQHPGQDHEEPWAYSEEP